MIDLVNFNEKRGSLFVYENTSWALNSIFKISGTDGIYKLEPFKIYFLIFDTKYTNIIYFYVISEKDPCERCWTFTDKFSQKYLGNYLRKVSS